MVTTQQKLKKYLFEIEKNNKKGKKINAFLQINPNALKEAKEIPSTFTTEEFERGVFNCIIPGIGLHVIGIKKDIERDFGDFTQEAL